MRRYLFALASLALLFSHSVFADARIGVSIAKVDDNFMTYVRSGLNDAAKKENVQICLLYTSPSPRDRQKSRMPSSA